ncbi:MAG: nuclear transport factor 2 family protein [Actinomycetes bacterium]
MGAPTDDELRDTVDHVAVARLTDAYADVVTRRAWPELATLFLPRCVLHLDTVTAPTRELEGPAAIGAFIGEAVERFSFFEFVVLNRRVELRVDGDADRATARIFMCELRQDAVDGRHTTAYGLYRDTYERVDGRWWFADRRYRSLARTAGAGAGADLDVLPWPEDL